MVASTAVEDPLNKLITNFPDSAEKLASESLKAGYLKKQNRNFGAGWRKRFFVYATTSILNSHQTRLVDIKKTNDSHPTLYYYVSPEEKIPHFELDVGKDIISITTYSSVNIKFGFQIDIVGGKKIILQCKTQLDQMEWIDILQACKNHPTSALANIRALRAEKRGRRESTTALISLRGIENMTRTYSPSNFGSKYSSDLMKPWYSKSIDILTTGGNVKKAPYLGLCSGKIKKRFIQLSRDFSCVRWGSSAVPISSTNMSERQERKVSEKKLDRHLPISMIDQVIFGPCSLTWRKYFDDGKLRHPWKCISLVVKMSPESSRKKRQNSSPTENRRRTVDLIFPKEHVFAWFVGLNFLVSEHKKSSLPEDVKIDQFEVNRDQAMNKKASVYKWSKLKLQFLSAVNATNGSGVQNTLLSLLQESKFELTGEQKYQKDEFEGVHCKHGRLKTIIRNLNTEEFQTQLSSLMEEAPPETYTPISLKPVILVEETDGTPQVTDQHSDYDLLVSQLSTDSLIPYQDDMDSERNQEETEQNNDAMMGRSDLGQQIFSPEEDQESFVEQVVLDDDTTQNTHIQSINIEQDDPVDEGNEHQDTNEHHIDEPQELPLEQHEKEINEKLESEEEDQVEKDNSLIKEPNTVM
ncbi:ADP-ribosylation factor GTPase-activating protein [Acrasis kona]|uniref:ADP-ribosylation factor GTPase-activating protein n=1 Tax=Acrasis kona TaxID=1008807 RepID=A0AAW2Z1S8_9EUKA